MKRIYSNQPFRLYILTGIDLTAASELKIIYKSPNKTSGEWVATIDPTDKTRMVCDCSALIQIGKWLIYAKAIFPQGMIPGSLASFTTIGEGTI